MGHLFSPICFPFFYGIVFEIFYKCIDGQRLFIALGTFMNQRKDKQLLSAIFIICNLISYPNLWSVVLCFQIVSRSKLRGDYISVEGAMIKVYIQEMWSCNNFFHRIPSEVNKRCVPRLISGFGSLYTIWSDLGSFERTVVCNYNTLHTVLLYPSNCSIEHFAKMDNKTLVK